MAEPHEILGVEHDADPDAIRARYLELVRQNPPEKDAARFAEIREAYDRLTDPEERLKKMLFNPPKEEEFKGLFGRVLESLKKTRPTTAMLRDMAAALDRRV